ncbi:histidinol-phosphate transaminase [Testudinibacter sp. TR-2022]|uniref:histidinol-phosphate transaminase n=1 Tax=Testudinibacter sp. TR-2022 TaxID=2585029 RepID=UPI0011192DDC|nr:histidinol-phosphate transaminase [Testudinibacter sp. TR-2022]TNH01748.1 histidinol-phosphate transaminase [Pasteurellaceae bacterium Phil31]TNH08119.1 histidinol-phosphate transaminase [Testudinibacter sp. TR-2022]TNH09507.1 histidinol-phosphate transaminase [Testudinibacter sp. TR-2022]TNH15368.1 histidinol-phosphate transaminase [Testudinibacter sp. TR-2022]TNH17136.1 histidinol-phosphate transaminase [Testudinibacter sp. TR-2022]
MKFIDIANPGVRQLSPYQAGKPIEELERELGISNIVKLASNENPFGFPESAKQAIREQLNDLTRYPDANGFELKLTIAQKFGLKPEQITLGNGSNDLLEITAHTFLNATDEVIFSQYTFIVYPLVSQAINAKAVIVPAKDYGHDLNGFLAAITEKTKVIYLANPNNPTGTFLTAEQIEAFLAQVPEHILVILDEAYTEFTSVNERVPSFNLLQKFPNLVVCRTLSKAYGLAGLRIGYMVSAPEVADLCNRVRQPFNCNSLALAAAVAVINDDDFIEKVADNNRQGLRQLETFFQQKGLDYVPSKGNFITLDLKQPAAPIYQKLLENGVIVRPIAGYGLPNHLRISIGLPEENQRFIDTLSLVLEL